MVGGVMRKILLFLLLITVICVLLLSNQPALQPYTSPVRQKLNEFWYEKTIEVSGLNRLSQDYVRSRLPHEKAVWWWLVNEKKIITGLKRNLAIKSVELKRCSFLSWGCFNLNLVEREPFFVAKLGEKYWLIDSDGAFIAPYRKAHKSMFDLPIVQGLESIKLAPQISEARLKYVARAIPFIESALDLKVKELQFQKNGELLVTIRPQHFKLLLSADDYSMKRLQEELLRAKQVLKEIAGSEHLVEQIDLALHRQAVLRWRKGVNTALSEQGRED